MTDRQEGPLDLGYLWVILLLIVIISMVTAVSHQAGLVGRSDEYHDGGTSSGRNE